MKSEKMKMLLSSLLVSVLLLLLCSSKGVTGDEVVRIKNVEEFKAFVSNVNEGNRYSGATVYLDSDLSLSEATLEPIGINETHQFRGTFDGQGYTISNLKVNSSSNYAGPFGYSDGLTTRNVVLDSSCTITSSYSDSYLVYMGGIIGYCLGQCDIENNVNMANVTYSEDMSSTNHHLYLGGIAGYLLSSSSYGAYVKNCVNYGSIMDSGSVGHYAELGGIVGSSGGSSNNHIQNCLNYGAITYSSPSLGNLNVGGIVGYGFCTYIENCVSAGKISTQTTASGNNYIGGIVGKIYSDVHINYCYHTSEVGASRVNGTGAPNSTIGTPDTSTVMDPSFVSQLNNNATSCNWSKWLLNAKSKIATFKMNDNEGLSFSSQIILIPSPVKEGNSFLFWCTDAECTEKFEAESVYESTIFYAAWVNNTVTFDFNNETTVNETFSYNMEIMYPDVKKEGYTLSWNNYHELMPAKDITVTAQWTPNNYTVTFDANGGSVSETSKIVTFDEKYDDLPEPTKEGYMFLGWFTEKTNGTEVTNETSVTTPYSHTLYAHWEEVTTQVEIVFSSKDLTKEEVEKLIEKYANAKYEITKFESEPGEIRVIVRFTNKKDAEGFVRNIKEPSEATNLIKRIGFVSSDAVSFSTAACPLPFFSFLW